MNVITRLLIVVLLTQTVAALGQSKTDSLLFQLRKSRPDSNQVTLLNQLSSGYLAKDEVTPEEFEKILSFLSTAIALCDSLKLDFTRWKAKSLYLAGDAFVRCDSLKKADSVFMALVKNAHDAGNKRQEAEWWFSYGEALWRANKAGPVANTEEIAFENAANIYREIKDVKGNIDMLLRIGLYYGRKADLTKSEEIFLATLKTSKVSGRYKLPYIYYWLCTVNRYMGNYNKALGYALQSVKEMKTHSDSAFEADYYGELAQVYEALGKPAESIIWYKKCISCREAIPNYSHFIIHRTYSLMITQMIKINAQKEALLMIMNLQKRMPPNSLAERAVLYQSLAYCYSADNVYDSTEKYLLKTVETYNKSYRLLHMADEIIMLSYLDVANFYIKHKQFKNASPYVDTLIANLSAFSVTQKPNVELMKFKVDSAAGSYLAAIQHFQQYKYFTDSVFNDKKSREIEELQIQYKTEKKDEQIGLLTKKDQLQQANLRQANTIKNWMMASAALLILLLGVGYNRYRFKQKTNKQLEAQQTVINQKNVSLQRLVNEKEWLMKEIHHRVKNNFHIVMGLLGTQSGYLKNDEAIAAIKESQQRIHAMSLIHQKLYQSESLSSIDMPGYIHELVDNLKESFDKSDRVQFHFQVHRISMELSHVIPIGLILNEAITNVFKYAFPGKKQGNIYLSFLHTAGNKIVLTIKDDGVGLPAGFERRQVSSMGLNLMKGLTGDIDGCFTIQSNNGTVVTVSFAYNPEMPGNITTPVTG